jgi:TagF N-terminal domain, Type VI secretion system-associated
MLVSLKKLFSRKMDCAVETYGKLPCYKDYISVVITDGAAQWRAWLLESFQGTFMPPEGVWHFIYQHRKNSDVVVGIIQASSDGLRQFPFSLFTVCSRGSGKGGLCSRPIAVSIWQQLEGMTRQLLGAGDVQAFYAGLYGKRISPITGKDHTDAEEFDFSCNREGEWPQMLVAETRDARKLHLIKDGKTTNEEFAQNWQGLLGTAPFLQAPSSAQEDITERIGTE